jgi:hypothetical protein
MPQIILKQAGQPVSDFSFFDNTVTVAGAIFDCAARQQDAEVLIEVRTGNAGAIEGGNGAYLAQIAIPARRYIAVQSTAPAANGAMGQSSTSQEALPLDPNAVQVTLWPIA